MQKADAWISRDDDSYAISLWTEEPEWAKDLDRWSIDPESEAASEDEVRIVHTEAAADAVLELFGLEMPDVGDLVPISLQFNVQKTLFVSAEEE